MKYTILKNIRFMVTASLLVIASCGPRTISKNDYNNNYHVKNFWAEFNKTEFLKTIQSKRSNVEDYVKAIKEKGVETDYIKNLYAETKNAYNSVLNKMSSDINSINNILDFSTLNATNKYQNELKIAEEKETIFINTAAKLLNPDEETSFLGDLFNTVLSFIPGARQIQEIYLNNLKADIQNKINIARWSDWSSI